MFCKHWIISCMLINLFWPFASKQNHKWWCPYSIGCVYAKWCLFVHIEEYE